MKSLTLRNIAKKSNRTIENHNTIILSAVQKLNSLMENLHFNHPFKTKAMVTESVKKRLNLEWHAIYVFVDSLNTTVKSEKYTNTAMMEYDSKQLQKIYIPAKKKRRLCPFGATP